MAPQSTGEGQEVNSRNADEVFAEHEPTNRYYLAFKKG